MYANNLLAHTTSSIISCGDLIADIQDDIP